MLRLARKYATKRMRDRPHHIRKGHEQKPVACGNAARYATKRPAPPRPAQTRKRANAKALRCACCDVHVARQCLREWAEGVGVGDQLIGVLEGILVGEGHDDFAGEAEAGVDFV